MKNVNGRPADNEKRKVLFWLVIIPFILLLSGCGPYAVVDEWQSKLTGDIDKQGKISAQDLRRVLTDHFGLTTIVLTDEKYVLPDNGRVSDIQGKQFAYCNPEASVVFSPMGWDCDDYAAAAVVPMRNYAFGTMFVTTSRGTGHALNVFVNHRKEVVYWEPQTCDYYYGRFHKPALIIF